MVSGVLMVLYETAGAATQTVTNHTTSNPLGTALPAAFTTTAAPRPVTATAAALDVAGGSWTQKPSVTPRTIHTSTAAQSMFWVVAGWLPPLCLHAALL